MERSTQSAIIFIAVLSLCTAAPSRIIHVDDDAAGPGNGSSWQNAYRFLQDALAEANDSVKPVEIHVAQGVYKPDQGAGCKADDPDATFQIINGVTLKGGYAGLGGPEPNVRDVKIYESILSGNIIDRPDALPKPDRPVRTLDDGPDANDPRAMLSEIGCRTVVTGSRTDNTAVLDGFVVTGGRYTPVAVKPIPGQPAPVTGSGAGMNNVAGSPTVLACTFVRNATHGVGGGMCNVGGSHPKVIDCTFIMNHAIAGGGGIYSHGSAPAFEGCTFSGNSTSPYSHSAGGGALVADRSTCMLTDCVFEGNYSPFRGGALHIVNDSSLTLDHCVFAGNRSDGPGGAMYEWGRNNSITLSHCTFTQNSSPGSSGGAMELGSPAQMSDCIFSGNCARTSGGAIFARTATFRNCLFVGNRAFEHSRMEQGVIVRGEGGLGGGVFSGGSIEPLSFVNCTFAENHARYGSAVMTDKSTEFRNCILRGPRPLIWPDPSEPQPQVTYCNVEHTWPGEGNIDEGPLFAQPGYWSDPDDPNSPGDPNDPNTIWVDGDYHLKSLAGRWDPNSQRWVMDDITSPCVDAGDPNSTIGEEPEPNGGRINMGAYGGTGEASMSYVDALDAARDIKSF